MPTLAEMLAMARPVPMSESQNPNLQRLIAAAMAARKRAQDEAQKTVYAPMIGVRG